MSSTLDAPQQATLRLSLLSAVEDMAQAQGGFLTFEELTSFKLDGVPRPLAGQRGIYNPSYLDHTLSISSSPDGPYDDKVGPDGLLNYAFEDGDPMGGANRKLRRAMVDQMPIILFERPFPNVWVPIVPAYVVDENRNKRYFRIAVGEEFRAADFTTATALSKKYVERIVRQRVHQPVFRARVVTAYRGQCAICRLQHRELLDAAHIIPDSDPGSSAEVSNGLSLCKLHHTAYDRDFLGIDPDYTVHINQSLLEERDGPMLRHGLQEMHGVTLELPRSRADRPDANSLGRRFEEFVGRSP